MRRRAAYLRGVHRPRVLAFAIAATAVAAACGGGTSGEPKQAQPPASTTATKSPTTSLAPPVLDGPVPIGTHAVGVRTEDFVDTTRPTPPNGGVAGSATRAMSTTVWYPATGPASQPVTPDAPPDAADAPYPLVVFAHGFANVPNTYVELLSRWASAGYVVVAPAIPLLNGDAPGGASHADYGPANIEDFGFVVDEALRRAAATTDPHFSLFALVDKAQVAVAGHSDGEVLAYALAFESCCHDPRVGAAVLLAGNLDNARALPAPTGVPVLHVMADLDEYNPYSKAIEFDRAHLVAPSYSLTLRSAHHEPPFVDPADPHFDLVARVTVDFLDMALKGGAGGPGQLKSDVDSAPDLATLEARSGSPAGP